MSTGNMPNPPDHLTTQAASGDVKGQNSASAQSQPAAVPGEPQPGTPAAQSQAAPGTSQQAAPAPLPGAEVDKAPEPQLPIGEDMARIIEGQLDVIAQRLVYHTQMMVGVSALGSDPVSARNTAMIVAGALRSGSPAAGEYALVNLGDAQIAQINDKTLPLKLNGQLAGLLEGILLDTVSQAYRADAARQREARLTLDRLFIPANEEMQSQPKAMIEFQAPGPEPNARQ